MLVMAHNTKAGEYLEQYLDPEGVAEFVRENYSGLGGNAVVRIWAEDCSPPKDPGNISVNTRYDDDAGVLLFGKDRATMWSAFAVAERQNCTVRSRLGQILVVSGKYSGEWDGERMRRAYNNSRPLWNTIKSNVRMMARGSPARATLKATSQQLTRSQLRDRGFFVFICARASIVGQVPKRSVTIIDQASIAIGAMAKLVFVNNYME